MGRLKLLLKIPDQKSVEKVKSFAYDLQELLFSWEHSSALPN